MNMPKVLELLNLDNEVFQAYCFWSSVLVLKMMCMPFWTVIQKFKKQPYSDPKVAKSRRIEDIERSRRAHRNDLENILPFFVIGFIYTLVDPTPLVAINLFRLVAISRIIHTLAYTIFIWPQPSRAIAFGVQMLTTVYMSTQCLTYFYYTL